MKTIYTREDHEENAALLHELKATEEIGPTKHLNLLLKEVCSNPKSFNVRLLETDNYTRDNLAKCLIKKQSIFYKAIDNALTEYHKYLMEELHIED